MNDQAAFPRQQLPDDGLPLLERRVVRLVVLDLHGQVLLLHAGDSSNPAAGLCWELPGGGLEAREDIADAARRELYEETGIEIDRSVLGPPTWRRWSTYAYRGERRLQHERVVRARLHTVAPRVTAGGRDSDESVDCIGYRWWSTRDIATSDERFYPGSLPRLIETFLRGATIDEPMEVWS